MDVNETKIQATEQAKTLKDVQGTLPTINERLDKIEKAPAGGFAFASTAASVAGSGGGSSAHVDIDHSDQLSSLDPRHRWFKLNPEDKKKFHVKGFRSCPTPAAMGQLN